MMTYEWGCTVHHFSALQSFPRKPKNFVGLWTLATPPPCSIFLSGRFFGLEGFSHRWSFDASGLRDSSSSALLADTCSVWHWGAPPCACSGTNNTPPFWQRALKKRIGSSGSLAFAWNPSGLDVSFGVISVVPDFASCRKSRSTSTFFCAWICAFEFRGGSLAPNTCIGGSGTWAGTTTVSTLHTVPVDEIVVLLLRVAGFLVPFCCGLLGLLFLALWAALCRTMPGRLSPLGMLLGVAGRGAPTACLRAFSFSSPRFAHCTSGSVLRCRPRCVRNVNVPRGRWSAQILLCLIGFSSAPTCVWAAPKGVEELGIVADRVQAAREFLPVELKHAASSIVERTEDPHDEALARVDPEPIQHSVARMQTEAMLEAYGEAVDPPCLKVVVLFPDGPDIMVLINDVSGGLAQIIKDTRDAVMCVSEETDLLVVEDQARHNVLHVMAVPKWVDASLRACILVDLSAVGGPSFASLTWTLVYRGDIDRVAGRFAASWDIYSSGEFSPWGPTGAHKVVSGMSVKVVPKGALPQWSNPLPNIPWHLWTRADPGPSFQQTLEYWLVSQDDGAWLVQHGCREAATLHDVIADRLGADQSLLDLVVVGDGDFVGDIRVEGLKISGVVAPVHRQASRTEDSVTTPVVFIDGRAVGRGVRSLKVSPGHLDPVAILRLIDPQIPTGYVAQVTLLDGSSLEDASVEPNSHLVTRVIVCQSTENPASSGEVPDAPVLDASLPTVLGSNAGEVSVPSSVAPTRGICFRCRELATRQFSSL